MQASLCGRWKLWKLRCCYCYCLCWSTATSFSQCHWLITQWHGHGSCVHLCGEHMPALRRARKSSNTRLLLLVCTWKMLRCNAKRTEQRVSSTADRNNSGTKHAHSHSHSHSHWLHSRPFSLNVTLAFVIFRLHSLLMVLCVYALLLGHALLKAPAKHLATLLIICRYLRWMRTKYVVKNIKSFLLLVFLLLCWLLCIPIRRADTLCLSPGQRQLCCSRNLIFLLISFVVVVVLVSYVPVFTGCVCVLCYPLASLFCRYSVLTADRCCCCCCSCLYYYYCFFISYGKLVFRMTCYKFAAVAFVAAIVVIVAFVFWFLIALIFPLATGEQQLIGHSLANLAKQNIEKIQ